MGDQVVRELPAEWRCFHCDFVARTPEEAEAHFGDGDEAGEFVPICKWWQNSDDAEKKHAHQSLLMDLNQARGEVGRMRELEELVDNFKRLRDDDRRKIEKTFGEDCTSLWSACDRYGNLKFALAEERRESAKATAYEILLTATSWGAALGAIAECEPDVVKVVDEYTARIRAEARQESAKL